LPCPELGRSSIDLYSNDVGAPFVEITSFAAYVGGCPTNISVGTRRLGMRSADDVLAARVANPGLAGLEITVEANGPSLQSMLPMLHEILERTRLILFVDDHFEELANMIGQLPSEGLYLIISDKFINTEQDYSAFITAHWSPHRERTFPL
jgi:hypothetical protein